MWHRGFIVCPEGEGASLRESLSDGFYCELGSYQGETAFAFSRRDIPDLGERDAYVVAINDGDYTIVQGRFFFLTSIKPVLEITAGMVLRLEDKDRIDASPLLRALIAALGAPAETGGTEEFVCYRWDVASPIDQTKVVEVFCKKLGAVRKQLDQQGIPYRITTFNGGSASAEGELEEVDDADVYGGPSVSAWLKWEGPSGVNRVTANEGDWICDGDDIPDSDVWTN